jgi:hypothetical protein
MSESALGPIQPPMKWKPEAASLEIVRQEREAGEVKNRGLYLNCSIRLYDRGKPPH